jgi:hypothetical protein
LGGNFNPQRLILNDVVYRGLPNGLPLPVADVGDRFEGQIVGIMDYAFNNYRLQVTELPPLLRSSPQREVTALVGTAEQVTIASYNLLNLAATATDEAFAARATQIVENLRAPDILALQEIQDNDGNANNGVVAADQTLAKLIAAIRAAGGPTYDYTQIDPVNNGNGGAPGTNIRTVILFNPARVSLVRRSAATETVTTTCANGALTIAPSPGLLEPTNIAFTDSRKPLFAEFTFNGAPLYIVANHLNSKGGDQPLFGPIQPPNLFTEPQRLAQATVIAAFARTVLACQPQARLVVLGDLNDFQFSRPLARLTAAGLRNLTETLPAQERYTYIFQGNGQVLDQILVNAALADRAEYDIVHINAEFFAPVSDHDPVVVRLR